MYKSENLKIKKGKICVYKNSWEKTTSTVYKSLSQNEIVKNLHRERKKKCNNNRKKKKINYTLGKTTKCNNNKLWEQKKKPTPHSTAQYHSFVFYGKLYYVLFFQASIIIQFFFCWAVLCYFG